MAYECDPVSLTILAEPGVYWFVVGPVIASDLAACPASYVATARRAALCPGDLDGDGDVDLSDLGQLLSNYGTGSGAEYEDGDLDCDRDVDLADLAGLLANYGGCDTIWTSAPDGSGLDGASSGIDRADGLAPRPVSDAEGIRLDADPAERASTPDRFGDSSASIAW